MAAIARLWERFLSLLAAIVGLLLLLDVLVSALPGRAQVKLNLLVALLAASACAAAAYYAGLTTWDHYRRGVETYGIYPIQKWTLLIVIAAGFAFTAVEFARKAQDHVRELRRDPGGGDAPGAAA